MRVLKSGMTGTDVELWQHFLCGEPATKNLIASGTFDEATILATKTFQRESDLDPDDGVVGRLTLAAALKRGFYPLEDDDQDHTGPNWPPVPEGIRPLVSNADRVAQFGEFKFKLNDACPGEIIITDDWESKNIVKSTIPFSGGKTVRMNKKIVKQFEGLWQAWQSAGLLNRVLTWDGGFVPRFVRGSTTLLSNHSWGTAFDLNAAYNGLGKQPALVGEKGCIRELIPLANQFGWYAGAHFKSRPDGMHFEVYKII